MLPDWKGYLVMALSTAAMFPFAFVVALMMTWHLPEVIEYMILLIALTGASWLWVAITIWLARKMGLRI